MFSWLVSLPHPARRAVVVSLLVPCFATASDLPRQAREILKTNCFACHGAAMQMSRLDLRTRDKILLGGERGPAVTPTNLKLSFLWKFVTQRSQPTMPPGSNLPAGEIEILRKWILAGAPYPKLAQTDEEAERLAALRKLEERPITEEERRWWAFQPPVRRQPPSNAPNPVDAFLQARLAEKGLRPAPPRWPMSEHSFAAPISI